MTRLFAKLLGLLLMVIVMTEASYAQEEETPLPETGEGGEVGEEGEEELDPSKMARELEDVEFRVSLPTEEDFALWAESGFRFQFGYAFSLIDGEGVQPDALAHAIVVRAGARLDESWSLLGTLSYGFTDGEICGLRLLGTIEPTWHPTPELSIALGWGLGGFVETAATRPDPAPDQREGLVAPYTITDTSQVLPICTGLGTAALARIDYLFIFGNLFSMGPSLEGSVMWTGCEQDLNRVEPDTAQPIVRRQWWQHYSISLGWMFAWR